MCDSLQSIRLPLIPFFSVVLLMVAISMHSSPINRPKCDMLNQQKPSRLTGGYFGYGRPGPMAMTSNEEGQKLSHVFFGYLGYHHLAQMESFAQFNDFLAFAFVFLLLKRFLANYALHHLQLCFIVKLPRLPFRTFLLPIRRKLKQQLASIGLMLPCLLSTLDHALALPFFLLLTTIVFRRCWLTYAPVPVDTLLSNQVIPLLASRRRGYRGERCGTGRKCR